MRQVGKYTLETLLGRGGMGEVWVAHDPDLDRRVALKLLHAHVAAGADAQARFQREGRAMAKLNHPNVIVVYEAGNSDGRGLIAMELVDGESLDAWAKKPHSHAEIVRVLLAAGRGLAAAHAAGMIHRDFKPHNVLVGNDGRVVVTDFGLARSDSETREALVAAIRKNTPPTPSAFDATVTPEVAYDATATPEVAYDATVTPDAALDATATPTSGTLATEAATPNRSPSSSNTPLTQTGALLGTPAYMAPEQLDGEADARADQWAFCVTAWELFCRERPFTGTTLALLTDSIRDGRKEADARIPRRLRSIVLRGLSQSRSDRWPDMERLLAVLDRAWRRPKRIAIASGVVAALGATAVAFALTRPDPPPPFGCDQTVASAWSPAIRAKAVTAAGGTDSSIRNFDRWAQDWTAQLATHCRTPDEKELAARNACLLAIRDEVAQILTSASRTSEFLKMSGLERFVPPPESCAANPRMPVLPPPDKQDAVAQIRLESIRAREILLRPQQALVAPPDLGELLRRAEAVGFGPVIGEVRFLDAWVRTTFRPESEAESCNLFAEVASYCESIGYDRIQIDALLAEHQCLETTGEAFDREPRLARLEEITKRARLSLPAADVILLRGLRHLELGEYEAAFASLEKARRMFSRYEWGGATDLVEARLRFAKRDYAGAEQVAKRGYARDPMLYGSIVYQSVWHQGRVSELAPNDRPADKPVDVTVRVVDDTRPVANARVGVGNALYADAWREAIGDIFPMAVGTTAADGTVKLAAPDPGTILVRSKVGIGVGAVPKGGGAVDIVLGTSASIEGRVRGLGLPPRTDPATNAERAVRYQPAFVFLSTRPSDRMKITFAAPLDAEGKWNLPSLVPGKYELSVQTTTPLDIQIRQATFDVKAGANTAPEISFEPPERILEVRLQPGTTLESAVVIATDKLPTTGWTELLPLLSSTSDFTIARMVRPRVAEKESFGDSVAYVSVPRGPHVVCVIRGMTFKNDSQIGHYRRAPETDSPPLCKPIDGDKIVFRP